MFNKIKRKLYDSNLIISMNKFSDKFGPETEHSKRRVIELEDRRFKVLDSGTYNIAYFEHRIFGPIESDI